MEKIGIFEIKTSFLISDRGIVAVGTFAEGGVRVGSSANIEVDGKTAAVKIIGVEWGNIDTEGKLPYGLLLSFIDDSLRKIAEIDRVKEQTIDIFA